MKRCILFLIVSCLAASFGQAQDAAAKGLLLPQKNELQKTGKTYALIVGISKYKNPAIPQLQFADRDAEAFRNYLLASGVDSDNITTLLNEKATNGEFWASLNFITDLAKQGDKVYIYFSGHGDVENKTVVKDAYLLPYDAPKCVYPAGAIGVLYLKSWIATFSAHGIQAVFIADACRSGNLAGGREGMEATAAMLKDKWQDEVKILSCQPGELSLEGKQWGGGRGLFSYELINGLAGMADKNKDGNVTLRELNLYLLEKVPDGASPMQQEPMLFGNGEMIISKPNPKMLAELSSGHNNTLLAAVDVRGFDDALLAKLDDTIKRNYTLFKVYMDSNILYSSAKESAYKYYLLISDNDATKLLKALMKRNLASALMNDLQKKLDLLLKNDLSGVFLAPENKSKALVLKNILGDEKLSKLGFMPKVFFFEGFADISTQAYGKAILKIDSAIKLDPYAAYLYLAKAVAYLSHDNDSAMAAIDQSIHISPRFVVPRFIRASIYTDKGEYTNASKESDSVVAIDPLLVFEAKLLKAMSFRARISGDSLHLEQYMDSLKKAYLILDEMTSEENIDPGKHAFRIQNILIFDFLLKDSAQAVKHLNDAKRTFPLMFVYYNTARLNAILNHKKEAMVYLQKYFNEGGHNFELIVEAKELDNIRQEPEYKALMRKYFPDQYKD